MTAEQIDDLAQKLGREIPELISDLAPHIREAAAAVLEETQDKEDAKPKLTVSIGIALNLAVHPVNYEIKGAVSVKRTASMDGALSDPEQPEMDLS